MSENTIIQRIKSKRKEQGLTQQELADKINVSLMTIVRWENGTRTPNTSIMPAIAEALNTSVSYLMGISNNPNPSTDDEQYLNALNTKEKIDKGYSPTYASAGMGDGMLYFRHDNQEVSLPDNEFNRPLFIQIISKMLAHSIHEGTGNIIKQDNNIGDNLGVING